MSNIPTPHIEAKAGDFAETVLMPGESAPRKIYCRNVFRESGSGQRSPGHKWLCRNV